MTEADPVRPKYITGRQSAHMTFAPRKPRAHRDPGEPPPPMPSVSVVSWEVREEICEPYIVKAVVTAPAVVSRKTVLGQFAKFTVQPDDEREPREFHGVVTRFEWLSGSRDEWTYRVVARQRIALLDGPSNCATYQNRASWEIIVGLLRRDEFRHWMQVDVRLRREHPKHRFRFQYNMGDWSYIKLEMEQAGLFCFTEPGRRGEVLVIADDVDGYMRPGMAVPSRPVSGLSTFDESIFSLRTRTHTVPESFVVADYNPENAWERLRGEASIAPDDTTMAGTSYVWGTHHDDLAGARREARLRHEAAYAHQVRYKAKSTVLAIRPGCVIETDRELEDGRWGMFVTRVVHCGARDQNYMNRFRAIPAGRPYRMPVDESRWPRIHGTLGATICSPGNYPHAYITDKGEYVARLHADFGNWPKGGESVPLRLAKPFAGRGHTGFHMPALDGDEAIIAFRNGDPNRPYIAGFHHNSQSPDLINSSRRRMSRNEIRTLSGNKLWMDDWKNQQGIELGTEHSGRSQLNLGFIPDGDLKQRGAGAELRTAAHLVGRGGAGVMLSAYNQPGGSGKVLDTTETRAQLDDHARLADSLARSAEASKALPADLDAQRAIDHDLDEVKKPGVLVTAPGPVGIASGDGMHVALDGSFIGTVRKAMHLGVLKHMTAAVGGVVSLFAQKGMKLIAAAGEVVMQAQRGGLQIAAQKDLTVETVDGVVHVKSPKEIILGVGGTYLKLTTDGIEAGTRGGIQFRSSRLSKTGPAQMDLGGQAFAPAFVPFTTDCEVWRTNPDFSEDIAAAPEPAQWENLANTEGGATAPDGEGIASTPVGFLPGILGSKREPITINDPDNAPEGKPSDNFKKYPKPVKLKDAASCNWQIPEIKESINLTSETKDYYYYRNGKSPVKSGGDFTLLRTRFKSEFQLIYDARNKIITAKTVIALVPKLLVQIDPKTKKPFLTTDNKYSPVLYHSTENGANSNKSYESQNYMLIDRDTGGIEASKYKSDIESALNSGNYKLILGGCRKKEACGCRIAVRFCVDVHVVNEEDAIKLKANNTIQLFPQVSRADALHWGEVDYKPNSLAEPENEVASQVKAHEVGHLFNFPDEYWQYGGFVHEQYIRDDKMLDFDIGIKNGIDKTNETWQFDSGNNLMGYGANEPKAMTRPYYLEYIRHWFSRHTHKEWLIGYNGELNC